MPKHNISDQFEFSFNHRVQTRLGQVWLLKYPCFSESHLLANRTSSIRNRVLSRGIDFQASNTVDESAPKRQQHLECRAAPR